MTCTTGPTGGTENCDDGNDSDNDSCLNSCAAATCGDNVQCTDAVTCTTGPTGGTENCDDGDVEDCGECNATCDGQGTRAPCYSQYLYVDDAGGADTNQGTSWAEALATIQAAIGKVTTTETGIFVREGTYTLGATIALSSNAHLYGGFPAAPPYIARDWLAHPTIVSGSSARRVMIADNVNTATVDGFVLRDGLALGGIPNLYGGAIYVVDSTITVQNSTFLSNTASYGGAITLDGSSLTITNATFSGNIADKAGAIYALNANTISIAESSFSGNQAAISHGGAVCLNGDNIATFERISFQGNSATWGGAIAIAGSGTAFVSMSAFSGNSAAYQGGAVYSYGGVLKKIENCSFWQNTAKRGAGVYLYLASPVILNCSFVQNAANVAGGAIHNNYASAPIVLNTITWGNTAPDGPDIYLLDAPSDPRVAYSDIEGDCSSSGCTGASTCTCLAGNVSVDPVFTDPSVGNLTIGVDLPGANQAAVDTLFPPAGTITLPSSDLDDVSRGDPPDMGAFEYVP